MKKLFIIFLVFFLKSAFSFAEENKCNQFKKLSKEYIECNAKKLKEASSKKAKELKDGTSKKTQKLKEGTSKKAKELKENLVEIGDKVKNKIKKKE
ncbi:hypothetical protein [Candidatus Pelagibacter sp. HIMB1593]|uniref:hypothetical protein n=1 Tax=Candidatus Pelagibacter sp. HIMB1593 TaxID=3413355 RepID=UPI003F8579EB